MCHKLDPRFFRELAEMDPAETAARADCDWDAAAGVYRLRAWGGVYRVDPRAGEIAAEGKAAPVNVETGLSMVFYLLGARAAGVSGEWISEKDLPGGVTFFRGPHAVPSWLVAERFGGDVAGFVETCVGMGGLPLEMADAAFSFPVLPKVPVAVLFWRADEEFGAESKLLFDRTISLHLPIDVVFGIAEEICFRISGRRPVASWY